VNFPAGIVISAGLVLGVALTVFPVMPDASAKAKSATGKYGLVKVFSLTVGKSGKCIAKAGGAKMGNQFHAWRCRSKSSHQKFMLKKIQKDWYQVRSNKGSMCLDVSGSAKKNDAPVVQWRCKSKGNANQLWKILPGAGGKTFLLKVRHSGKCLHLSNSEEKVSTFVQRPCKSKDQEQNLSVVR